MKIGPIVVSIKWVGFDSTWKRLASKGRKIDAIKILREERRRSDPHYSLVDAKDQVNAYLSKF